MKLISYIFVLFVISFVFVAGNSFAQPINPFVVGNTPQFLEWYKHFGVPGAGGPLKQETYSKASMSGWDTAAASTMISSQLRTPQGDYLAEISDLIIDPVDRRVSDIVLTGVRGMGGKPVIIPFKAVSRTGGAIFIYNAPEGVSQFGSDAPYRRWGLYLYSAHQKPVGSYAASEVIGVPVRSPEGEKLGRIDDLVIDSADGRIVHLVVSHISQTEGRMACIPFSVLSKNGERAFVLKTTKEALDAAPTHTWVDMANRQHAEMIFKHYGQHPYWE